MKFRIIVFFYILSLLLNFFGFGYVEFTHTLYPFSWKLILILPIQANVTHKETLPFTLLGVFVNLYYLLHIVHALYNLSYILLS